MTRCLCALLALFAAFAVDVPAHGDQYQHKGIVVPNASADEPKREQVSPKLALDYLEKGSLAWTRQRACVTCHTNGSYLQMRPSLTQKYGKPSDEIRQFFVKKSEGYQQQLKAERKSLLGGIRPTEIAYIAAGLAEWDTHVSKALSQQTKDALELMFAVQSDDGAWGNTDCWPPFESSRYQGTTVAAAAAAAAPGWLEQQNEGPLKPKIEKMKKYLRESKPAHDYARVLLLWTAAKLPDLLDEKARQPLIDVVFKHQRDDGGWSIRNFAAPDKWGSGNRAAKLKGEADFKTPPSDGHMTGLAVLVLREAGVPADDKRIQAGVKWLQSNQRVSGRWWTRSLNTDNYHFITYSGTLYALAALEKCGQ